MLSATGPKGAKPAQHAQRHFTGFGVLGVTATVAVLYVNVNHVRNTVLDIWQLRRPDINREVDSSGSPGGLWEFSCSCSEPNRYTVSWCGSVPARSVREASYSASRNCADFYNRPRSTTFIPPPDSFVATTDPVALCHICECIPSLSSSPQRILPVAPTNGTGASSRPSTDQAKSVRPGLFKNAGFHKRYGTPGGEIREREQDAEVLFPQLAGKQFDRTKFRVSHMPQRPYGKHLVSLCSIGFMLTICLSFICISATIARATDTVTVTVSSSVDITTSAGSSVSDGGDCTITNNSSSESVTISGVTYTVTNPVLFSSITLTVGDQSDSTSSPQSSNTASVDVTIAAVRVSTAR